MGHVIFLTHSGEWTSFVNEPNQLREAKTSPRSVGFRSVGFFLDGKNLYKSFSKALIPQKSETIWFLKKKRFLGKLEKKWDR